jgi:hypothetical protein
MLRPFHTFALPALMAVILAGCGKPIPAERSAYIGDWRASQMLVLITADGYVNYERREGNVTTKVNAPLKRFEGDDFVVGFGPFETTFVVTSPPRAKAGTWTMTVDGVELRRAGQG